MADYTLQYPGATIDQLLSKVNRADGTPTANSENLVKSGGVKSYVDGKTGDLSQLQTTAKTSLVAAINEASQSGSENAVLYVLQNLTAEQKAQARANIDALSPAELDEMQIVTVTTLPTASASTMGNLYLVGPDENNNYLRYFTQKSGSSYSWVAAGSTVIDLSRYATKEEVNQLKLKVNGLFPDVLEDGFYIVDPDFYIGFKFDGEDIRYKNCLISTEV